jgi:hypothetical protein
MSEKWSQRLVSELAANVPPDVADWLDGGARRGLGGPHLGDFTDPIAAEALLDSSPDALAGGLMLPDTLPLLGNGHGDAISLRFGPDGHVSELIRWHHEGGNWRPFGNTLAEAILCDIGSMKAASGTAFTCEDSDTPRPWEQWAVDWVRRTTAPRLHWGDPHAGDRLSVFQCLLDADTCEVAVRRERCWVSLMSGLGRMCLEMGGRAIAERVGVTWPVFERWLFDTATVPEAYREPLSSAVNVPIHELVRQDWGQASREASQVRGRRPGLTWPHVVLGWAAERDCDLTRAAEHYTAGLKQLGTSGGLLVIDEHEFSIERLRELGVHLSDASAIHPRVQVALAAETRAELWSNVRAYWLRKAEEAAAQGDHGRAYQCYYRAGWDDYVADDIGHVLDGLVRSAEAAGYTTLCRLAERHRASWKVIDRPPAAAMTPPASRSWLGAFKRWGLGN